MLLAGTAALYWPALRFDFINLDDPTYVLQNPKVSQGVTWSGIIWAFKEFYGANWHPLTWISHMVDVSLFGLKPMGHHATNLVFHVLNSMLLFLLLRQMTGAVWRSAIVAGLFAWHPTHVESVAWVSERKDVLSTFFGLLSLMAYAAFVKSKVEGRESKARYMIALVLFALGLMSKPMLVTWPFVMLLLDIWPLRRCTSADGRWKMEDGRNWTRLLVEKIPFFALTVASCLLTFFAQRAGGAVQSMGRLPAEARIENAVVSYVRYIGKTFWPSDLSAFYPHPVEWPGEILFGSILVLVVLLAIALWKLRSQSFIFVGLCWFLGTLVPVIGLVQVGGQSIADRYLYIPQVGLLIAAVWGAAAMVAADKRAKQVAITVASAALIVCPILTHVYLPKWRSSAALFKHVLSLGENNPPALYSLGLALCTEGKYDEAIPYLVKATDMDPTIQVYQGQLALAYEMQGDIGGAIERYRKCIELSPDLTEALNNLAWLLATSPEANYRNGADAIKFATRACELTLNEWPMFLGTLAAAYAEAGRFEEAIKAGEKAEQQARKRGFTDLADQNLKLLETYRAGKPHRERGGANR
jgi:hypothetical protein